MARAHLVRDDVGLRTYGDGHLLFDKVDEHDGAIDSLEAMAITKRTLRIQHSDLTDAVNGHAQAINIGAVLPAGAVVLAHEVNIATLFSGGGATAVKMDVGGTTSTAITNQADVFTGAATGKLSLATGSHVRGSFGGEQLKVTFTPDASHTLDGLTAGDLTITIWFAALP